LRFETSDGIAQPEDSGSDNEDVIELQAPILSKSDVIEHLTALRDFVLVAVDHPNIAGKICEALTLPELEIREQALKSLKQKTIPHYFTAN
jgi:hypothetical protein